MQTPHTLSIAGELVSLPQWERTPRLGVLSCKKVSIPRSLSAVSGGTVAEQHGLCGGPERILNWYGSEVNSKS